MPDDEATLKKLLRIPGFREYWEDEGLELDDGRFYRRGDQHIDALAVAFVSLCGHSISSAPYLTEPCQTCEQERGE